MKFNELCYKVTKYKFGDSKHAWDPQNTLIVTVTICKSEISIAKTNTRQLLLNLTRNLVITKRMN